MKTTIPLITIGLDLGDKKHVLCVLNQDGDIIDERTITNHRESLRNGHCGMLPKNWSMSYESPGA